jgi:hypothetical protein
MFGSGSAGLGRFQTSSWIMKSKSCPKLTLHMCSISYFTMRLKASTCVRCSRERGASPLHER